MFGKKKWVILWRRFLSLLFDRNKEGTWVHYSWVCPNGNVGLFVNGVEVNDREIVLDYFTMEDVKCI